MILYSVGRRSTDGTAFCFGYLSHIVGDALAPLLDGELYYVSFFLWPVVPAVNYGPEAGFTERLAGVELTLSLGIQIRVVVLATLFLPGWRDAASK